jgi:hypothetical protein
LNSINDLANYRRYAEPPGQARNVISEVFSHLLRSGLEDSIDVLFDLLTDLARLIGRGDYLFIFRHFGGRLFFQQRNEILYLCFVLDG